MRTFCPLSTSLVLFYYSLFSDFRSTQFWPTWMGLSHHTNVSTVVLLDSSFTQVINPTTLLSRLSFFFAYLDASSIFFWIWDCPSTLNWKFRLTPSKDSTIAKLFESDLIILCSSVYFLYNYFDSLWASIITYLNNDGEISCVDFLFILSIHTLLAF